MATATIRHIPAGRERRQGRFELEQTIPHLLKLSVENNAHCMPGEVQNVSENGMRTYLPQLKPDLFAQLVKGIGKIEVQFSRPGYRSPLSLTGQVVWINHGRTAKPSKRVSCQLGVFFEPRDNPQLEAYMDMLEDLCPIDWEEASQPPSLWQRLEELFLRN